MKHLLAVVFCVLFASIAFATVPATKASKHSLKIEKATTAKTSTTKIASVAKAVEKKDATSNHDQYNATVVSANGQTITTYEPVFEKKKIKHSDSE